MRATRWLRFTFAARPAVRKPQPARRQSVEPLEDRSTPSTGGALDPTFGAGGTVATSFSNHFDTAQAVTVQPDGKVVVAGGTAVLNSRTWQDFLVARYNPDGSRDTSFGTGGSTTTDFNRSYDSAAAVVLQSQATGPAKILAAGMARTKNGDDVFALVRYKANGTLDPTFGNKGKVTTDLGGSLDGVSAMLIQPDGKILLVGASNNASGMLVALARYTANGALDATFGSGGKVVSTVPTQNNGNHRLALQAQPDGSVKIVVAMSGVGADGFERFEIARFNPNGSLDTGFGSGGFVTTAVVPGASNEFHGLAVLADGRIVATGDAFVSPSSSLAAVRYTRDGQLDPTFGPSGTGIVTVPAPAGYRTALGGELAVQADGQLLLGAQVMDPASLGALAVLRLNGDNSPTGPAGTVDTGYGVGGYAVAQVEYTGQCDAITVGPDGRAVVAGQARSSAASNATVDVALARFLGSAPQVGSFVAAPNPAAAGSPVTLTAGAVTDGNAGAAVSQVAFYRLESDGSRTLLGTGTANGDGTWSLTIDTTGWAPGTYTLLAEATDSYGAVGDPISFSLQLT